MVLLFSEDKCIPETVVNGNVDEVGAGVWRVTCDRGYTLVGRPVIKCRSGQWSASFPSCTGEPQSLLIILYHPFKSNPDMTNRICESMAMFFVVYI